MKGATVRHPWNPVCLSAVFMSINCSLWAAAPATTLPATTTAPIPVTVSDIGQVTLETDGKLNLKVVLTNNSDAQVSADVEFQVQQDPALYSQPAPLPRFGHNIAPGTRSWYEIGGKVYDTGNAMTDGKPWTAFGGPMNNKEMWEEAYAYVDLGRTCRIVHMGRVGGEASRIFKMDFAASLDGKTYTPIEGLQNVDLHLKWTPSEIDVPKPFEARYLRLRQHNDGKRIPVFSLPAELCIYDGEKADTWDFPQAGARLLSGGKALSIAAKGSGTIEIGDGRVLGPGAYLIAVRTKTGDVTQMNCGRVLVMPPAMDSVTRESRFGMNGIEFAKLARRQGYGWVRFENLKWPKVSAVPGVYCFDGTSPASDQNFDRIFLAYRENGLSIMPFLFLTAKYQLPKDGKPNVLTYPPVDMSKYGEFVFQAVARYGSKKHPAEALLTSDKISGLGCIDTFELWNEADLNDPDWGSWRGVFNDYFIMYRHGAEAVKKADPDARVANGGWSGMGVALMESMRTYKYPDGKCPLDFTDVLSVHYYSFRVPRSLPSSTITPSATARPCTASRSNKNSPPSSPGATSRNPPCRST